MNLVFVLAGAAALVAGLITLLRPALVRRLFGMTDSEPAKYGQFIAGGSTIAAADRRQRVAGIDRNEESAKLPEYPYFDWLRFVLASIVVIDHHGFTLTRQLTGGLAVDCFFALSGWLIGGILLRTTPSELPRFYFNRATRIWIPYAVAIALLYGVALLKDGEGFFWWKYLFFDSTFTHLPFTVFPRAHFEMPMEGSGNQFWSISVEEQFYLFAPLVILFLRFGRSPYTWLGICAAGLFFEQPGSSIALGVAAAIVHHDRGWRVTSRTAVLFAALAAGLFGLLHVYPIQPLRTLFALAVVLATSAPGYRDGLGVFFGGLSFPLYLNHWIGIFAVHFVAKRGLPMPNAAVITLSYLLNVALAAALYWVIDRQIQKHRSKWFSPTLGRRLAATGYGLLGVGLLTGSALNRFGPNGMVVARSTSAQSRPTAPSRGANQPVTSNPAARNDLH